MSTSSIIEKRKSVCERNIKGCNYIKADKKRRQTNRKGMISFQDSFGAVTYNILQEFEAKCQQRRMNSLLWAWHLSANEM